MPGGGSAGGSGGAKPASAGDLALESYNFASDVAATLNDFISGLSGSIEPLTFTPADEVSISQEITPPSDLVQASDSVGTAVGYLPVAPTVDTFGPIDPPTNVPMPEIGLITPPTLSTAAAPTVGTDPFTGELEPITPPTPAVRPTLTLPDAPSFDTIVAPTFGAIEFPTLDATPPDSTDITTIDPQPFSFSENYYSSANLTLLTAKLNADLQNGGYGIEPADETALWFRARDRELQTASLAAAEVARTMAARGFSLPAGAMLAQLNAAHQEALKAVSAVSRDIALKRADMYVENRKFTLAETRAIEQMQINYYISFVDRMLQAARAVAEFSLAFFNAKVTRFNSLMQGYKTQVEAYAEKVRAQAVQIEVQKLQIEVAKVGVDINVSRANLYKSLIEGQQSLVEIYRTDVQAMVGLAEVEKLKLETFKTRVEVFAEQTRAQTLQLQGYEATIRADVSKVEAYKSQITAQMAQVDLAKAQAQLSAANANIAVENLRANLSIASNKIELYRAGVAAALGMGGLMSSGMSAAASYQGMVVQAEAEAGKLELGAAETNARTQIANAGFDLDQQKTTLTVGAQENIARMDTYEKEMAAYLQQTIGIIGDIVSSAK